jgi:hypothetical protein
MKRILIVASICSVILLFGCVRNIRTADPDVSNVPVVQKFLRFEKDLFNSDFEKLADSIPSFKTKYGEFFDIFNYKIIKIGNTSNPAYPDLLKGFVTDYNMHQVYKMVESEYENTDSIQAKIKDIFRHYKYYFPNMAVPTVVTYISGFNQTIVTSDTILGIGLDKFLGSTCTFYEHLGTPKYSRVFMKKSQIPTDCAKAWAITQFPMSDSLSNLLAEMIYQGKVAYFTQLLEPTAEDSAIIGMTNNQIQWCKENESRMWAFLVERKYLFSTDNMLINKFTGEGPFTKDFGRTSPARAAVWIGWHIVSDYMRKNKEVTLNALMHENDYQKILRLSKYKP